MRSVKSREEYRKGKGPNVTEISSGKGQKEK